MTRACNPHCVATVVEEVTLTILELELIQIAEVEILVTDYSKLIIVVTREDMEDAQETQDPWFLIQQSLFQF
jgi:nitrate reductase NapAB chaperone NapD